MKLEGDHIFKGPRNEVWDMFMDVDVLSSALPGMQKMEQIADDQFEGVLNLRIGPVSGVFSGKLTRTDLQPPEKCTLIVDGKGAPGFAKGTGNVVLSEQEDGTTLMTYDGDVQIGGTLASVGQRMLDSVSKSMIRAGFDSLDKSLEARIKAKDEGVEATYVAPTEAEFAKTVAKDMAGGLAKNRLLLYLVPAVIVLIILAFVLSSLIK
jgi:uncharacterized protein